VIIGYFYNHFLGDNVSRKINKQLENGKSDGPLYIKIIQADQFNKSI